MKIQELPRHIKKVDWTPLYLILGEEAYFRDQALDLLQGTPQERELTKSAKGNPLDEAPEMFQSDVVYGDETNASEILELAQEVSFFSSHRRVFVKWADKLSAKDGELLTPYFQEPSQGTTVIFVAAKLDGRTKWVQTLKKQAILVDCAPLVENQRSGWVSQRAGELGLQIEPPALEMLKEQANEGLYTVIRELEKLVAYLPVGQRVQCRDVELVRGKPPGISVFDWSEAVSRGDHGRALDIVAKNLDTGEAPLRMLGAFLWQMRRLWKASGLLREGKNHGPAARQAGIPPFRAREFMQQVQRWPESHFRQAWSAFARADSALKGGRASSPKLILDHLVIELCRGKLQEPTRSR